MAEIMEPFDSFVKSY